MRRVVRALLAITLGSTLLSACGGDDGDDTAALLNQAPVATRVASPFEYRLTLLTADGSGDTFAQITTGIYDHDAAQASIEVVAGGEGPSAFTDAIMIDPTTRLLLAIDDEAVFLRVDIADVSQGEWTALGDGAGSAPSASGSVSILNALTAGDTAEARRISDVGELDIDGIATTQYRVELPVVDAAPFLPREILTYLADQGFRREQVSVSTHVDAWIDAEGLVRGVEIDFQPLIDDLSRRGWDDGADVTRFEMIFEITEISDALSAEIPSVTAGDDAPTAEGDTGE